MSQKTTSQNVVSFYNAYIENDQDKLIIEHAGIDKNGHTFTQRHNLFLDEIDTPEEATFTAHGNLDPFDYRHYQDNPDLADITNKQDRFAQAALMYMEDTARAENNPEMVLTLNKRAMMIRAGGSRAEMMAVGGSDYVPEDVAYLLSSGEKNYALDTYGALHSLDEKTFQQAHRQQPDKYKFVGTPTQAKGLEAAGQPATIEKNAHELSHKRLENLTIEAGMHMER